MIDERKQLYELLLRFRCGELAAGEFCSRFETIYNLQLDKSTLSATEAVAFREVFDKVVWYSPSPTERARIPNYVNEIDVMSACRSALSLLELQAP